LGRLTQQEPTPQGLETNRHKINAYLARINGLSLFPTALYVTGLLFGVTHLWRLIRNRKNTDNTVAFSLCTLLIGASLLGYLWFVIRYPRPGKGDTIKATYMLQIFPFVFILVGGVLDGVRRHSKLAYTATLALLALVFAHNLPVVITRYIP
jgi:hypothetical protein